ncbi:VENN motif pre-toxin domain-containing protein, partial [Yersinia enterocolitica]
MLTGVNNECHADSTTHAAVSDGSITLRDTEKQQQNVADLSRDVEHANNALSPIFDKDKEQNRLREAQLIGEIGSQVSDVIRTQGDINGLKAAKEKLGPLKENATEKDRAEYMEKLRNSDVYKDEMKKNGTGSALQQGVQAATAAIQGLAGGLAGGSTADAVAGAQAGKNALENNSLGLGAGDIGFWLGNTPDCDTTCKSGIAKGIAEGNLVVSAGVGAVAGGAMI